MFTEEIISAVAKHMNDDHGADNVLIVRGLGGVPDATAATMTSMDGEGLVFAVEAPGGNSTVQVPWTMEVTDRPAVRVAVVKLYEEACAALGIAPRGEGDGDH